MWWRCSAVIFVFGINYIINCMKKLNCILLVDDHEAENYYNNFILSEAGVSNHIKTAFNGVEALEYLKNSAENNQNDLYPKPELILLDINMPRMNGFEFLEEYKKIDEDVKSSTTVIMLTSSSYDDDHIRAAQFKDVKEYLIKPLTIEAFNELINKHFRN
jgi:CheY-like chemotaxis protein